MPIKGLIDSKALHEFLRPVENVNSIDIKIGSKKINFEYSTNDVKLHIDDQKFAMTDKTCYNASRVVGIPEAYASKCPISLLLQNLNYWYNTQDTGLIRFLEKDNEVVGVSSKAVQIVSPSELINDVETVVGKENILGYHLPYADLDFIKIPVVLKLNKDILVDDVFHGGIYVQTSLLGTRPVEISGYLCRLVCSNGAISTTLIQKWSRRNLQYSASQWVKDAIASVQAGLEAEFESIKRLTEVKIDNHASATLNSIFDDFSIPATLRKEIETEVVETGAATMYDLYNSISKVATYSEKFDTNPYMGRSLQMVASEVSKHASICGTCHRVL